ncbi:unnamed protein product [Heligmosomoides polygyrus]|uniref:DRTGG domain-containing protein n=1 Tax=Heligmosomoides polygyrus TaxID=6339 RepID=A0A183GH01_HELPZ|nr:unnamed protein product [Heligmosomoides polygyrus]
MLFKVVQVGVKSERPSGGVGVGFRNWHCFAMAMRHAGISLFRNECPLPPKGRGLDSPEERCRGLMAARLTDESQEPLFLELLNEDKIFIINVGMGELQKMTEVVCEKRAERLGIALWTRNEVAAIASIEMAPLRSTSAETLCLIEVFEQLGEVNSIRSSCIAEGSRIH